MPDRRKARNQRHSGVREHAIQKAWLAIRQGLQKSAEFSPEEWEIAEGRIAARGKFSDSESLYLTKDDARFATPDVVANYRARKLSCGTIVDIGCGIGGQSLAFAKTCGHVVAVDNDERKLAYLELNAKSRGIKNISTINADYFSTSIGKVISKADRVFCDPSRAPSREKREIAEVDGIIRMLSPARGLAIEIPAQLTPEKIPYDCEAEYLSVLGKLNRLTLYFGQERIVSVVELPSEQRLEASPSELENARRKIADSEKAMKYIYEPNTALSKSGMDNIVLCDASRYFGYFTSDSLILTQFAKRFEVLWQGENDEKAIRRELARLGAGSILLRGRIPHESYWDVRSKLERHLKGDRTLEVFVNGTAAAIAIKA